MAFTYRTLHYWSPTQVKLYVLTESDSIVWIEDAVGIDLRIEDQKIPHYGFRDRYFRAVSHGRTIVSGNLYVNFRYPNYLSHAVKNAAKSAINADRKPEAFPGNFPTEWIKSSSDAQFSVTELKNKLLEDTRLYTEYADILKKLFHERSLTGTTIGSDAGSFLSSRPGELQTERDSALTIQIVYGDTEDPYQSSSAQQIRDVYITGTGHTVSMLDGNGDRNIIEVYPFFASNIVAVSTGPVNESLNKE